MSDVRDLVIETNAGNSDAFAEIVRRYRGLVFSTCYRLVGDRDDSEDLTQEVFLCAHRDLASLHDPERLGGWLCGIAENVCRMHLRRQSRTDHAAIATHVDAGSWSASTKANELRAVLDQALSKVSANSRRVLSLRYAGGYSYAELAALCDLPEKTIKSRLHEAKEQLKSRLLNVVAELCDCDHGADKSGHCALPQCGDEPCPCVDLLRSD